MTPLKLRVTVAVGGIHYRTTQQWHTKATEVCASNFEVRQCNANVSLLGCNTLQVISASYMKIVCSSGTLVSIVTGTNEGGWSAERESKRLKLPASRGHVTVDGRSVQPQVFVSVTLSACHMVSHPNGSPEHGGSVFLRNKSIRRCNAEDQHRYFHCLESFLSQVIFTTFSTLVAYVQTPPKRNMEGWIGKYVSHWLQRFKFRGQREVHLLTTNVCHLYLLLYLEQLRWWS
jgi:hypothetical protein